jgi:hypothetical protein
MADDRRTAFGIQMADFKDSPLVITIAVVVNHDTDGRAESKKHENGENFPPEERSALSLFLK